MFAESDDVGSCQWVAGSDEKYERTPAVHFELVRVGGEHAAVPDLAHIDWIRLLQGDHLRPVLPDLPYVALHRPTVAGNVGIEYAETSSCGGPLRNWLDRS